MARVSEHVKRDLEQRAAELRAQEQAEVAELKRLNDSARAERLARESEEKTARDRARSEEEEALLKAELKRRFMSGPGATAEDFERLYPELRDEHLKQRHADALAAMRQDPRYNI